MWLMEEVTTNMGRDQKALRNLRLISPSGMAIKKVMNKTAKSAYHFVASGHSRNVIATAHIVIYKMSRKRDGSSHWNNFSHKSHFPCKKAIGNCCNASMELRYCEPNQRWRSLLYPDVSSVFCNSRLFLPCIRYICFPSRVPFL